MNNYNNNFWKTLKENSNDKTTSCIDEWDFLGFVFNGVDNCICGKDIKNLYEIKNSENDNILIVGSSCVKKFMPNVHMQYKTKVQKIKKEMKDILKYYDGHRCKKCKIYWKKVHRCPYNKLNEAYKIKIEEESFIKWINNLKDRRGQALLAYEYLEAIKNNRVFNKMMTKRYYELEKQLKEIESEV